MLATRTREKPMKRARLKATSPETIAEVIDRAQQHIAQLSGVPPESVKLDLKIDY